VVPRTKAADFAIPSGSIGDTTPMYLGFIGASNKTSSPIGLESTMFQIRWYSDSTAMQLRAMAPMQLR
jgi:hypothetical protein